MSEKLVDLSEVSDDFEHREVIEGSIRKPWLRLLVVEGLCSQGAPDDADVVDGLDSKGIS